MSQSQAVNLSKSARSIIETATELFWKHGIRRITINEICEEAEVSKMTFYRNFENKYQLAHLILERQFESNVERYNDIMCSDISYRAKISRIMDMKRSESANISMELVKDIFTPDEDYKELKELVEKAQTSFLLQLRQDFQNAKDEGHLRQDLSVDFIIYMLHNMGKMMEDEQLIKMFSSTEELSMNMMTSFFYGILEQGAEE